MDLKVCRICGEYEGVLYLFSKTEDVQLSAKIMYCCSKVNIGEDDGLPAFICASCEEELGAAFRFAAKCEATDKTFRSLMAWSQYPNTVLPVVENETKVEVKEEDICSTDTDHKYDDAPDDDAPLELLPIHQFKLESSTVKQSKKSYTKHVKYKSAGPRRCLICGRECASPSALAVHMRYHTGEAPYCCSSCDKKYKDQGSLKRHIDRNHTQRERNFICETCGKGFFSKNDVKIHMRIHTGETPYSCNECPRQFTQVSALLRHKRTHTGEKPHKCSKCCKQFSTKDQLNYHQLAHSTEKSLSCAVCSTPFKYKNNLKKHMLMHTAPNNFVCNHCGRTFNYKGNLKIHIDRSHSEKSGFCNICSKNVSNYEVHMWRHTGQRPLKCDTCSSGFFDSKSLTKHINYRHKNPDKFECSYAGCCMKFPSRPMVEFHIAKQHERRISFPCDRCSRGFYRKNDLARHKLGTHKERLHTTV